MSSFIPATQVVERSEKKFFFPPTGLELEATSGGSGRAPSTLNEQLMSEEACTSKAEVITIRTGKTETGGIRREKKREA